MAPIREALPYRAFVSDPSATAAPSTHKRQRVGTAGSMGAPHPFCTSYSVTLDGLVVRAVSLQDFGKEAATRDCKSCGFPSQMVLC
jgi:hypothetical protein